MACTIKGCPFEGCDGGGDHTANLSRWPFLLWLDGAGECDSCRRVVGSRRRIGFVHARVTLCVPCLGDLHCALSALPEMRGEHP